MRQCLWQRGERVLSLGRRRLAGSEVMQCSLNVEAAVPASRACLFGKRSRLPAIGRTTSLRGSVDPVQLAGSQGRRVCVVEARWQDLHCHYYSLTLNPLHF